MSLSKDENSANRAATRQVTEGSFWKKIKANTSIAGYEAIYNALVLFYTARAKETPVWCKSVIMGALGYFISMIDGIPDLTPVLGYTDDIGVMLAAISVLATHITPEIKDEAKARADRLFNKNPP